jgi:hypothetical protein
LGLSRQRSEYGVEVGVAVHNVNLTLSSEADARKEQFSHHPWDAPPTLPWPSDADTQSHHAESPSTPLTPSSRGSSGRKSHHSGNHSGNHTGTLESNSPFQKPRSPVSSPKGQRKRAGDLFNADETEEAKPLSPRTSAESGGSRRFSGHI